MENRVLSAPVALLMIGFAVPVNVAGVYSRRSTQVVPAVQPDLVILNPEAALNAPPLHSATVSLLAAAFSVVIADAIVCFGDDAAPAFVSAPATQSPSAPVPQSQ